MAGLFPAELSVADGCLRCPDFTGFHLQQVAFHYIPFHYIISHFMSGLWFVRRILMIAPGKRLHHLNWTWVYMNILFCFIHIYIIWINYIYVFEYSYYASTVFGNTWKHPNQGSEELAVAYCIYGSYVINIFDLEARSSLARAWTPSKHAVNLPEWSPIAKLTEAHIFPLLKANGSTKWNTGQLGNTNATRSLWPRVSSYPWDSM